MTIPVDPTELPLEPATVCEQCGQPFPPRRQSGGSTQRFCTTACRRAFHKRDGNGGDAGENVGDAGDAGNLEVVSNSVTAFEERLTEFDWANDDAVVLHEQRPIAVYINQHGDLVIRQEMNWPHEEQDTVLIISRNNAQAFLDKICDVMGIGGVRP